MRRLQAFLGLTAALAGVLPALADPVPVSGLAVPPASAQRFTIMSAAGKHGTSERWTAADGTRMGRESMNLRGQIFEMDSAAVVGADGMFKRVRVRGFTPNGDAGETFAIEGGKASWKSPVDAGSAAYTAPADYNSLGGTGDLNADLIEAVVAAPGRTLAMLPGGKLHAEALTTLTVGEGPTRKALTAYAITGFSSGPVPVWVDADGKFFAIDLGLTWIPVGYEADQPRLAKAQDEALASLSAALPAKLETTPAGPVAFSNVRAFLTGDHFAEDETVVVDKGLIVAAGPSAAVAIPPGAKVIDGHGETLVPGLWDSHQHVSDDSAGPMLLSLGVTSVRDPGNVTVATLSRAERRAKGTLLMPHVYPSMLIDGKGPNTAQVGTSVASLDEALATVRKAHDDGFIAIKFYGTFNPAWVAPTAAEAHRLGMHVHGHIPAGMRTTDAIADGYDEITHIYFVMMQAMPDSVVNVSNGIARFEGPGRYAKDVDLNAEPMKSLIAEMAAKKIASDPTLVVAESLYVPENGDLGRRLCALRGDPAALGGARLSPGRLHRAQGPDPRRLPGQLRQAGRSGGRDAQGRCSDRGRHGWFGHRAGPRAGALRPGRLHPLGSPGQRDNRHGPSGRRGWPHRLDHRRQGRRPRPSRRRPLSRHRRPAPHAGGDDGRQADGRRRAAGGGRVRRKAEVRGLGGRPGSLAMIRSHRPPPRP